MHKVALVMQIAKCFFFFLAFLNVNALTYKYKLSLSLCLCLSLSYFDKTHLAIFKFSNQRNTRVLIASLGVFQRL